jgi:hypothetical protein
MEQVYLFCAIAGGTVFICQFLLGMLGLGGDHDHSGDASGHDAGGDAHDHPGDGHGHGVGHDGALSWFLGMLSIRTVTAGVTFFGLGGLAATGGRLPAPATVAIASVAGFAALYLVAWTMKLLGKLRADGTVHIEHAVGLPGTVYLTIPANKQGAGKVTLNLQNRTMEYQALTASGPIPTGASVVVVGVLGPDTVEVAPAA